MCTCLHQIALLGECNNRRLYLSNNFHTNIHSLVIIPEVFIKMFP